MLQQQPTHSLFGRVPNPRNVFTSSTTPRDHPHRALQALADMPTGDLAPDHQTQRSPSYDEEPHNSSNQHNGTSSVQPLQSSHPRQKDSGFTTVPGADTRYSPDTLSRYMRYAHRHHKTRGNPSTTILFLYHSVCGISRPASTANHTPILDQTGCTISQPMKYIAVRRQKQTPKKYIELEKHVKLLTYHITTADLAT